MGRDLYETYPAFRAVWDNAPVDFDLSSLCWEGPEEQLSQTRYTQPCMVGLCRRRDGAAEGGRPRSLPDGGVEPGGIFRPARRRRVGCRHRGFPGGLPRPRDGGGGAEPSLRHDRRVGSFPGNAEGYLLPGGLPGSGGNCQLQLPRTAGDRGRCRRRRGGVPAGPGSGSPPARCH